MESSPLVSIPGSTAANNITVEEYDDNDNLLRSYEYYDPTRSSENKITTDEETNKYGIKICIYLTNEHGQMNKTKRLEDKQLPAHAIVYRGNSNANKIGELNITGPCPTRKVDVVEYRAYKNTNSTEFNKYRSNILQWANFRFIKKYKDKNTGKEMEREVTRWVDMQEIWEEKAKTDLNR
jgi:hypothetical protein